MKDRFLVGLKVDNINQRLHIFFQIGLKVIKIMRSKHFSFGFAKDVSKLVIFGENVIKVRKSLYKIYEAYLNIQRVKTELKLVRV